MTGLLHSPDLIAKECNRVIHLEHGRIVEVAKTEEISLPLAAAL
ncbi:hypothetical protein [Variovorax sp. MHTC-1]|nr:hypothetical protein [Variovorax sp. MHTC-1]